MGRRWRCRQRKSVERKSEWLAWIGIPAVWSILAIVAISWIESPLGWLFGGACVLKTLSLTLSRLGLEIRDSSPMPRTGISRFAGFCLGAIMPNKSDRLD